MKYLLQRRHLTWLVAFAVGLTLFFKLRASDARPVALPEEIAPVTKPAIAPSTSYRAHFARFFALVACLLMALSAYYFRPASAGLLITEAALLAVSGAFFLMIALWLDRGIARRGGSETLPYITLSHTVTSRRTPVHWLAFALGVVYLALLAEISANLFQSPLFANISHHIQFALFVVGIFFVTWGLGAGGFPTRKRHTPDSLLDSGESAAAFPEPRLSPPLRVRGGGRGEGFKWTTLAISLITLIAFAARFYEIGDAVHHLVDEIHFSTAVAYFWLAPEFNVPLLAPFGSITAFPWLFPYMQFGAVNIFGRDLEGLRAVSALFGTLTIPALYLLARTLFDRRVALIAALLLATFPPHVNFSRIGLNNTADPLFGTLALAFLARGLKHGRRIDFAIGGAALGLTQYFYEGGRFLYIFLVCLWLIWFILWGHRDSLFAGIESRFTSASLTARFRRRHALVDAAHDTTPSSPPLYTVERGLGGEVRTGILTFLLTAALIAAPVYYTLYGTRMPFSPRMDIVGVGGSYWIRAIASGGGQTPLDHLLTPFLTFVYLPEQALYYGGEHPMILEIFVPLFLLGLAYALWRWRWPGMLLLLWVALTCVGNSLMTYSAIYARYVVVFPALALLIALGLFAIVPPLLGARLNLRLGTRLVSGAALIVAVVQVAFYFGPHLQFYNQQIRPIPDFEDALFRAVPFPRGTMIHLITHDDISDSYVYGVLGYLADHLSVALIKPDALTPEFFASLSPDVDHAFYVTPLDTTTLPLLEQHFTLQPPAYSPFNVPVEKQYILYYADAGE